MRGAQLQKAAHAFSISIKKKTKKKLHTFCTLYIVSSSIHRRISCQSLLSYSLLYAKIRNICFLISLLHQSVAVRSFVKQNNGKKKTTERERRTDVGGTYAH